MKAQKGLRSQRSNCGFTLVEIMIVVVIIGLLAAIAIPAFREVKLRTNTKLYMNELRLARDSVEMFVMEHGRWPEDVDPEEVPDSGGDNLFSGYLDDDFWSSTPSIGGRWDYEGSTSGVVPNNGVGISVIDPGDEYIEYLEQVDRSFDDGNLGTGRFQFLKGDRYTLILKE